MKEEQSYRIGLFKVCVDCVIVEGIRGFYREKARGSFHLVSELITSHGD